jgi:predicted small lipoprotein YifL
VEILVPYLLSRPFQIAGYAPVLVAVIALTVAGCGRRGALEAPPGAPGQTASGQNSGNRLTPGIASGSSRQSAANRDPLAPTSRTSDGEEEEPPIPAPNRPFILDAIL